MRSVLQSCSRHGTQPAGVERTDEEVRHDAPLRLFTYPMDQGKAGFTCEFISMHSGELGRFKYSLSSSTQMLSIRAL